MEHEFTSQIKQVLFSEFGPVAESIYQNSSLLQYLINGRNLVVHGQSTPQTKRPEIQSASLNRVVILAKFHAT